MSLNTDCVNREKSFTTNNSGYSPLLLYALLLHAFTYSKKKRVNLSINDYSI